jgi:muramoyltetrapeptide carboxypeptidase
MRILPMLDHETFRGNPKVFVGFSDLTAILLYLLGIGRMVAFHGPTLTSADLSEGPQSPTSRSLFRAVLEGLVPEPITGESWSGGTAQGPLVGGCLSIITSLLGTPFFPHLSNTILFLEDIDEPLYRIDRMLHHLLFSGVLGGINGLVLGALATGARRSQLRELVMAALGERKIPVLFGVPCGHGSINLTLPMGTPVRLDGDRGVLYFLQCGADGAC